MTSADVTLIPVKAPDPIFCANAAPAIVAPMLSAPPAQAHHGTDAAFPIDGSGCRQMACIRSIPMSPDT